MAQREQKSVNVYGDSNIQTVQTALDKAQHYDDVETEGGALRKLAFTFILEEDDHDPDRRFDSPTLQNAIAAAMQEPHVRTVEDAMDELAEAYTGRRLE